MLKSISEYVRRFGLEENEEKNSESTSRLNELYKQVNESLLNYEISGNPQYLDSANFLINEMRELK